MTFDTEYMLSEFRDLQPEIFDQDNKVYTGIIVSRNQIEQMLILINKLEEEIKTIEGGQP